MSPIDASNLDVTVTEGEQWRRTLNITVPADVVQAEKASITDKLSRRMNLKGFRSGKVPKSVIQRRFGGHVEREALDQVIQDAYRTALENQDLRPISEGEIDDVEFKADEPLTFSVSFDVRPEVTFDRLGGFKAERPSAEVTEDQITAVLDRLRDQNAGWEAKEDGGAEDGDLVNVTVSRIDEASPSTEPRPYEFVLGSSQALPDIEAGIKTLDVGAEGTFDIGFPEDFPDEERRGERQTVTIVLDGVKAKVLPEANDEFAQKLGEFETLEALTEKIKEDLAADAEKRAEGAVRTQLLDHVLAANPFDVPVSMVDGYLSSILGSPDGVDQEKMSEVKEQLRGEAEVSVKRMLAIDRIAELNELHATEDDVDDRVESIADQTNESASKVYASLQKAGRLGSLEQEITENKVFDFLKSESEITDAR